MNTIITALGQRKFADAVALQVAALPSRCGYYQANAAERKRIADRCCDFWSSNTSSSRVNGCCWPSTPEAKVIRYLRNRTVEHDIRSRKLMQVWHVADNDQDPHDPAGRCRGACDRRGSRRRPGGGLVPDRRQFGAQLQLLHVRAVLGLSGRGLEPVCSEPELSGQPVRCRPADALWTAPVDRDTLSALPDRHARHQRRSDGG